MTPRALPPLALAAALSGCGPARVDLEPSSAQLFAKGQQVTVHATPASRSGSPMPGEACRWSSSDEKVVRVVPRHNEAAVVATGNGHAAVRCDVGGVGAELPVAVTLVARVEVEPREFELRVTDEPQPTRVAVRAFDGDGREVQGRPTLVRCLDEAVCRGDARGQLWAVGAGATRAVVRVDDGEADAAVRVVDARSAAARPRAVKGNPMEHLDEAAPAAGARRRTR
jgi:hypothetical protein